MKRVRDTKGLRERNRQREIQKALSEVKKQYEEHLVETGGSKKGKMREKE